VENPFKSGSYPQQCKDHLFIGGSVPSSAGGSSSGSWVILWIVDHPLDRGSSSGSWIILWIVDHLFRSGPFSQQLTTSSLFDHAFISGSSLHQGIVDYPFKSGPSSQQVVYLFIGGSSIHR
jgi:hypothetical protein